MKKSPKMAMMPAQPTQDTGAAPAVMPSAQPMSTPTAPALGNSLPSTSVKGNSPHRGTHNPDNVLPPGAFHGKR